MSKPQAKAGAGTIRIALAGNPNSGKTTIFNALTGFHQHVGNYPGVTVEKKEGRFTFDGRRIELVDLPGIYSLTAYSEEELVARRYILEEKPDVLIDVVDAANIERNLFLSTQFMELGVPMVIALNMSDVARARGIEFDVAKLSRLLGVRIVPTVGQKGEGVQDLIAAAVEVARDTDLPGPSLVNFGPDIEREIEGLLELLRRRDEPDGRYDKRWMAIKLLENDPDVAALVGENGLIEAAAASSERIRGIFGDPADIILADRRYGFISGACTEAVRLTVETRHTLSDRIDDIMIHGVLGIPVLLALMYAVFWITFTLGEPPMGWIEWGFGQLAALVSSFWPEGSQSPLRSLLVDGIIGGVGGVLVFLPNILLLFLGISLLEDTGYMARAAFIMDRMMHRIGLHGKSFIPLLIGFGCSIPAIMATRTLENRRDRLVTMLIVPLMSCGARLPIYALLIPAFFPQAWQAPVLWMIYVTGILLAIVSARLLTRTVLSGPSMPFVMELPPYRLPTLRSVVIHMWEKGKSYLRKAGTIILAASVLLWAIAAFPVKPGLAADAGNRAAAVRAEYSAGVVRVAGMLGLDAAGLQFIEASLSAEGGEMPAAGLSGLSPGEVATVKSFLAELERIENGGNDPSTPDPGAESAEGSDIPLAAAFYLENVKKPAEENLTRIQTQRQREQLEYSLAGRIGGTLEKALSPLGFDWKISTALIGAFAAKEVFVAQIAVIYAVQENEAGAVTLRENLRRDFPPLVGLCILLFCLIGTPCVATLAITRKESGSWKWAILQWTGLTAMAYVITFAVYQVGRLLGIGV